MGYNESSVKRKLCSTKCLYLNFFKRSHTSNLKAHLKALEQKEANTPKKGRQQEIIKLRGEINKLETKRTMQRINAGSLRKSTR